MAQDESPERRDDEPERGAYPGAGGFPGVTAEPERAAGPAPDGTGAPFSADQAPPNHPSPWARPDGAEPADQPPAGGDDPAEQPRAGTEWSSGEPGWSTEGAGQPSASTEHLPYPPGPGAGIGGPGYQLFSGPQDHPKPATGVSRRRMMLTGLALALVAALLGGTLGGVIGYQVAAHGGRLSVLDSPLPDADSAAAQAGPVEQIAQRTLPSVVQLRVVNGRAASVGSGMIVSPDGLILTNNHVVASAATGGTLNVLFQDGRIAPATIVGRSKTFDVAVVKVQNVSGLQPITLGNSDSVRVGQNVVAIGSPLELGGTVTSGIVSALNRAVPVGGNEGEPDSPPGLPDLPNPFQNGPNAPSPRVEGSDSEVLNAIQTDAAINPGNSGGPLVDIEGKVVGINTAIASLAASGQGGSVGLGFAIPVNQVKRVAEELERTGHANRAVMGVKVQTRSQTGPLSGTTQAAIVEVSAGGPAAQANLKSGDVISKVDQRPVTSSDEVVAAVLSHAPGDRVTLTMGDGRTIQLGLGSQPSD